MFTRILVGVDGLAIDVTGDELRGRRGQMLRQGQRVTSGSRGAG
jgi:hypothetical protein